MSLHREVSAELGRIGEEAVANYLKSLGYIIIKRNWKDRYGEIDIIAENKECIAFVEVKTRTIGAIVSGNEAVDQYKMRRVKNTGLMFLNRLNTDLPPRFDVAQVTASFDENGKQKLILNYIKSAF